MKTPFFAFLLTIYSCCLVAQTPNFSFIDVNNVDHQLYDYLGNGQAVVLNFSATWSSPDWEWHSTGILENFYQNYGLNGGAGVVQVFHYEVDELTPNEALQGLTNATMGDWFEGKTYPFVNEENLDLMDEFGIVGVPCIVLICPDGNAYSSELSNASFIETDEDLFWDNISDSEFLSSIVFQYCDLNINGNVVAGNIFNDVNSNCENETEIGLPTFIASINDGENDIYRISNSQGNFKAILDSGNYTINVFPPNENWSTCPEEEVLALGNENDSISLNFAAEPTFFCGSPTIEISSPFLRRCFDNTLYLYYCNEGTLAMEDTYIEVLLDSSFTYISSSVPLSSQDGLLLTFDIGTLDVFECGQFSIDISLGCEDVELGVEHCYSASIFPLENCGGGGDLLHAAVEECQLNIGSFDPNDKKAIPAGNGPNHEILPASNIKYLIRFQNTGTDTAFKVVVVDTLSHLLDMTTFRRGASSHNYELQMTGERVLEFVFNNINLPDSTVNEPASNGFFDFSIQLKPDLENGTIITNEAGIYFDFNDPIVTNTIFHTINDNIVSNTNIENKEANIVLSPNPASSFIHVKINQTGIEQGIYEIISSKGDVVRQGLLSSPNFRLNLSNIVPGFYFLRIKSSSSPYWIKKFVID